MQWFCNDLRLNHEIGHARCTLLVTFFQQSEGLVFFTESDKPRQTGYPLGA
jgi:hypothetical protein